MVGGGSRCVRMRLGRADPSHPGWGDGLQVRSAETAQQSDTWARGGLIDFEGYGLVAAGELDAEERGAMVVPSAAACALHRKFEVSVHSALTRFLRNVGAGARLCRKKGRAGL